MTMLTSLLKSGGVLAAVGLASIGCGSLATAQVASKLPTPAEILDKMARDFSPAIPPDVDPALQKAYEAGKKFPQVQLLFDVLSWESFVAACWPTDQAGQPQRGVGEPGRPGFDKYPTDGDIFDRPAPAGLAASRAAGPRRNRRYVEQLKLPGIRPGDRVLALTSSTRGNTLAGDNLPLGDVKQAFKQPIWDQDGFMVRYEILVNDEERAYILDNGLETINGQAAFSQSGKKVTFPSGVYGQAAVGAVELKLGWKVLGPSDDEGRFLATDATILTGTPPAPTKVRVGLIGMHIAHKTASSPQWVWSTFSHVDALNADALATNPKTGKPRAPLFTNPGVETASVNVPSSKTQPFQDGLAPTQVLQLTPIPLATRQVNLKAQAALAAERSVLQYYELLNTQWPTNPSAPPTTPGPGTAPGSINNKSGGNPTPVYLVNPLFETYFQVGNQAASGQEESGTDPAVVFGTESCMGCHSSAPVATLGGTTPAFGPQLSGDFSWLLRTKAK